MIVTWKGQCNGSVLDCRSTGRLIDPASGVCVATIILPIIYLLPHSHFISVSISSLPPLSLAQYSLNSADSWPKIPFILSYLLSPSLFVPFLSPFQEQSPCLCSCCCSSVVCFLFLLLSFIKNSFSPLTMLLLSPRLQCWGGRGISIH